MTQTTSYTIIGTITKSYQTGCAQGVAGYPVLALLAAPMVLLHSSMTQ